MNLIVILLIFAFSTGIYNFGYLVAARIFNYLVEEFSIGIGPKIASFMLGNTRFVLKLFFLGGYVKFRELRPSFKSVVLICCGPLATILFSFSAMSIYLYEGFEEIVPDGALIYKVPTEGTARNLQKGDVITAVNEYTISYATDFVEQLDNWGAGELNLKVLRNGKTHQIILTRNTSGDKMKLQKLGVVFGSLTETKRVGIFEAIWQSPCSSVKMAIGFVAGMWGNSDFGITKNTMLGKIGAIESLNDLLLCFSLVAFFVGVFNMLPLPWLVGGQAVYALVEILLGYSLKDSFKEALNSISFLVILIVLIFFMTFSFSPKSKTYKPRSTAVVLVINWSKVNIFWGA